MKGNESRIRYSRGTLRDSSIDKEAEGDLRSYHHKKLRAKQRSVQARSGKLTFDHTGMDPVTPEKVLRPVREAVSDEYHEDNAGAEAMQETSAVAESGVQKGAFGHFSRKLHPYDKAEKLEEPSRRHSGTASGYAGDVRSVGGSSSANSMSRWQQRQAIKREYAEAKAGKTAGTAGAAPEAAAQATGFGKIAEGAGKAAQTAKDAGETALTAVKSHPLVFLVVIIFGILVLVIVSSISSCSALVSEGGPTLLASSYTAEDEEIKAAEAAYCALEEGLRERIRQVEAEHPGYDTYEINASEIGHDPYELVAFLTVLYEDYTLDEVQVTLEEVFGRQYEFSTGERTEMAVEETPDTRRVLTVSVVNNSLNGVVTDWGLTEDEIARYRLLVAQRGNREDLFAGNIYAHPTEALHYDIPGEALSDVRFARMIQEGEKYLGYPYVWGGSSPATSFDCSGFVSWVINHSGNGWNVGRPSAEGLRQLCAIIPVSDAEPGDLVFFQGTYDTAGASHVGIYVGDSMMLHCGNPIQYASIDTSYWQQHYLCFGRLPG